MNIGYIYIRRNEYWDLYDAFKLGKTKQNFKQESDTVLKIVPIKSVVAKKTIVTKKIATK